MARDYIEFDCSPCEESCVQVSDKVDYMPAMREEVNRFKALVEAGSKLATGLATYRQFYQDRQLPW